MVNEDVCSLKEILNRRTTQWVTRLNSR